MAVKNKKKNKSKKYKKKNNIVKKQDISSIKKQNIVNKNDGINKEEDNLEKLKVIKQLEECLSVIANDNGNMETDILNDDNNSGYVACKRNNVRDRRLFGGLFVILVIGLIIMFFPRIKLFGEDNMIISYKDNYVEPGYKAYILNKNISDEVVVIDDVDYGILGNYQIKYYLDKFGIKFKKIRNVSIVDEYKPEIKVVSDVISICPKQDVPNIEYRALDEYDGDITSKVEKIITDNEILLKVGDSSDNFVSKKIKIDRVDNVKPVIKLKGSSTMFLVYGKNYVEPGYTVSDNCNNDLSNKVKVTGNVGRNIGTYVLTYEVEDESGNIGKVTRKVIVGTEVNDNGTINKGVIYLTFDDGPNQGTTNKILDILKAEGVKATFFVTCNGPDSFIKRMHDEGHVVALHTATHNYSYIYSSIDNYFDDLNKVSNRVKKITGIDSKIIRFPGGSSNTISRNYNKGIMTELSNIVLNQGYRYFDWNIDGMDASSARNSGDVYYNVTSNLSRNRANVVLLHDTKNITVNALKDIIRFGKEYGYKFSSIDMDTYMVRHKVNN